MFYIILALFLLLTSVIVHVCLCRRLNKKVLHARAFCVTAGIFFGIYVLSLFVLPCAKWFDSVSLWGYPFKITGGMVFLLLIPVYLSFYVLTRLTSPSKKILDTMARRGELSYADILACVKKEDFIATRLNDLCASGCVRQTDGRYVLTSEGQKIATVLDLMQLIIGRGVGG